MKWLQPRKESAQNALIGRFIELKSRMDQLPPLNPAARAEFDYGVDIDHLYYSSKIEGTNLSATELKRAAVDEKTS